MDKKGKILTVRHTHILEAKRNARFIEKINHNKW